ncbi:hypothetical protein CEUSTIGMA_g10523.t1 [Chlamydomonas eustigma]|uniref:UBX domain-containing protein n=1 Tax=Chlamydomonas eustigma TaxID=1157962 RepID=A0A250XJ45_9CHLO|nr:hypothetical protein CEUSTIGMA_g10523.t1 [Chlamydomonas eustigma]|eukprot:GAX83097.1 hypothetical protein CEUSTIGMA_g10523.t1 [Chlamydomonas eustigma]
MTFNSAAAAQLLAEQQSETHTKELLDTSFKYDVAETELVATNEGGKVNGEIQKNDLETEMHSLETKLSGSKANKSGNRAVGSLISESNYVEQHRRWVEKAQQDVNEAAVAAAVCKSNGLVLNEAPSPASDSKRTLPEAAAAAGIRSVAAAGPTATLKPSASSSSLVRSKGTGSSSNMIPLAVAQEANERQQQWLQQLQHGLDAPERARATALDQERALRREQDDEYHKALEEDMNRLKEAEALRASEQAKEEEEKRRKAAAEAHLTRLKAAREEARTALRGEPEESASTLLVRVRLPSGAQQQRRFILADQVSEVEAWVDTLEEIPLGEERSWRMMTSFPRAVLGSSVTLQEVADGSTAVALFIELTS